MAHKDVFNYWKNKEGFESKPEASKQVPSSRKIKPSSPTLAPKMATNSQKMFLSASNLRPTEEKPSEALAKTKHKSHILKPSAKWYDGRNESTIEAGLTRLESIIFLRFRVSSISI